MELDEMDPYPTQLITSASSTNGAWPAWHATYTTTGVTLTSGDAAIHIINGNVWGASNAAVCTGLAGCTSTTCNTWPTWNDEYTAYAAYKERTQRPPTQADLLAETERKKADEARWIEQQRIMREAEAKRAAIASAARRRARDLLDRSLSPEQREDLAKKDCFYLESIASGGERRKYRIDRGTHGNVKLLDKDGRILGTYCVQPNGVPIEDAMLAQKLWIETDEEAFVRVANFSPYHHP